jgi:hypothetical protein
LAVDTLLAGGNSVIEKLTLRRKPQPAVENLGIVEGNKLVAESTDFSVKDETFEIDMC